MRTTTPASPERLPNTPPPKHSVASKLLFDVSSISTNDGQRDGHLKSGDFSDVFHYPTVTFRSCKVQPNGEGGYNVTGDLTIHGQTRQQTFVVDGPTAPGKGLSGNTRIGFSATTKINRKDSA